MLKAARFHRRLRFVLSSDRETFYTLTTSTAGVLGMLAMFSAIG